MKIRNLAITAISASFLVLGAGCSSDDAGNPGISTPWLGTLQGFERVGGKDEFGVFRRIAPGRMARFERGILVAPEITVSARSDLDAMHPETYEKIKSLFDAALRQELAKQFPITAAGAGRSGATHEINIVLNRVTVTRSTNNTLAVRLEDLRFSFPGATIEGDFRELTSNARAAAIVLSASAGTVGWNALRDQLSAFARQTAEQAAVAYKAINEEADKPADPAPKESAQK
mgnify:CR=1 FL=1